MDTLNENQERFIQTFNMPIESQEFARRFTESAYWCGVIETAVIEKHGMQTITSLVKSLKNPDDVQLFESYIDDVIKYNDDLINLVGEPAGNSELMQVGIELLRANIKLLAGDLNGLKIVLFGDSSNIEDYGVDTHLNSMKEKETFDQDLLSILIELISDIKGFILREEEESEG